MSQLPAYRNTEQYRALIELLKTVRAEIRASGLDKGTAELMNLLASSINGCEECWNTHARQARRRGVDERKMQLVQYVDPSAVVRDKTFSPAEQAALFFTFALTEPARGLIPEAYAQVEQHFSADQVTAMEWLVVSINSFNRITIAHENDAAGADA